MADKAAQFARRSTLERFFRVHHVRYPDVIAHRVASGERRARGAAAEELQQYAGIAPVIERSGNKAWVHERF
jgi:hypothetical protein